MPFYMIRSYKLTMVIEANNMREAWKKFFRLVKEKRKVRDIGHLASLIDEKGEEYIFRTVPALYAGGVIDKDTAVRSLMRVLKSDPIETEYLLMEWSRNDSWVWT